MVNKPTSKLNSKKRYLQVALNGSLEDAYEIIKSLPKSDRIILEAGTPFIKRYGESGIRQIRDWYEAHLSGNILVSREMVATKPANIDLAFLVSMISNSNQPLENTINVKSNNIFSYIVADLKTMDRGEAEVEIAVRGGASGAIALGTAPVETLNSFIQKCEEYKIDAMIDMMNIPYPLSVLHALKKPPKVVIIHRGVDEEKFNHEKQIPLYEIRRIKGSYNDIMISIAGGDTLREVQSSVFNDADIVVIWKSVFQKTNETIKIVEGFLKEIK